MELIAVTTDAKEKQEIYKLHEEVFPPEERLPVKDFIDPLLKMGCDIWALYDQDFVGFTIVLKGEEVAYIWYLAICPKYHSKGYGSQALQQLQEKYQNWQLILDMEPVFLDAPNYEQRKRRLAFYERNGFYRTGYAIDYFDIDFEVLCQEPQLNKEAFVQLLKKIETNKSEPRLYSLDINI